MCAHLYVDKTEGKTRLIMKAMVYSYYARAVKQIIALWAKVQCHDYGSCIEERSAC